MWNYYHYYRKWIDGFDLNENEYVIYKEIKGMNQLLDGKKMKIKNCEEDKLEIGKDSTNYEDYIHGGVFREIVENIIIKNKQFENIFNIPEKCEYVNTFCFFCLIWILYKKRKTAWKQ